MVVQVGVMELPVTEDPDDIQTYMNGEHLSGGLWTALTRASNHDHSGGLSGVQLGATSIPDGSITTAKLDPAVLLPYALVDGSKPFTGQVTMQADAIVRDTLYFGQQGTALPPDATLARAAPDALRFGADVVFTRTGPGALRVDTHLGVGVSPQTWHAAFAALHVGTAGVLAGSVGTAGAYLRDNSWVDASGVQRALYGGTAATSLNLIGGALRALTAPAVAAGAEQTFTERMALSLSGTLAVTPDAGQAALLVGGPILAPPGMNVTLQAQGASNVQFVAPGGAVHPLSDGSVSSGASSARWSVVYAVAGTISMSQAQAKEGITPLDPLACYQATKDVRWYEFVFRPPAYQEPEPPPDIAYDASDDNETKAEKKARRDETEAQAKAAHLRMVAETAPARHQRGFVFPDGAEAKDEAGGALPPVPDLFGLSDRESATPGADVATLGCALQEVIRRLEALEEATA